MINYIYQYQNLNMAVDLSKDTSVPNIIGTNNYLLVVFD